MNISNFINKIKTFLLLVSLLALTLSCSKGQGKFWDPPDLRKIPANAEDKRERNIQEGRGITAMGVLTGRKKGSGTFDFASSNEMWRASLELLDFTPLQNVDYSGGIIVTDWFSESSDQDPIKITVRFLSNEIRADGLKVIIHKKNCKKIDDCRIAKVETTLGQEIKLAILKKAAFIKDNEKVKNPKFKIIKKKSSDK